MRYARLPFPEPGLDDLLQRNLSGGRPRFSTDYTEAAETADVHFICAGTPQRPDGMGADLTYVGQAVTNFAPLFRRRALIVGKSTVPPSGSSTAGTASTPPQWARAGWSCRAMGRPPA